MGLVAVLLPGVLITALPWLMDWQPQWHGWHIAGVGWDQATSMAVPGKRLLSASAIVWTLPYAAPLVALRRLGHRLYHHDGLSQSVARAFRWLAHALLLCGLCGAASSLLASAATSTLSIALDGFYVHLVACLCLYSVAHLLRLASEAAEDARSIV